VPTSLTGSHDSTANTNTINWTAPASSTPAVDFYRIYRDGTNYSNRIDTTDAVSSTVATATSVNATSVTVASTSGGICASGLISVDTGANQDNVTISSSSGNTLNLTSAMPHAHAVGVPVACRTLSWTDSNLGGSAHTYYVTAVSANLAESTTFLGPSPSL
jgi:hypothetical protein